MSLRIGFNTRVSSTSGSGPAVGLRDGIELSQPPAFSLAEKRQWLSSFAETVAPALGWTPTEPNGKETSR